jgi:hypothetical protein
MKDYRRISLIVVIAVLGGGATAHAQPRGRFDRVTTTAQGDAKVASKGTRAVRPGGPAPSSRSVARANSVHPYSTQKMGQTKATTPQIPGSSTWQLESERPAAPPPKAAPSQPHTFYPHLAAGRAAQQPVKLKSRATMVPPIFLAPGMNQAKATSAKAGAGRRR